MNGDTTSEPSETKMETEVVQETKLKISFGVKRKEEPKLVNAPAAVTAVAVDSDEEREDEERQTKRRKMTHFDEDDNGDDSRTKNKSKVVIPMVVENDWRVTKLLEMQKEGKLSEADEARLALLTEDNPFTAAAVPQDGAIVVGEADDQKIVEDADYESVRIEDFGLAMLRGCGWKDGDGIGKNPQKVPLQLLKRRPHGLGLGATPAAPKDKKKTKDKDGEELETEVKAGSFVKITTGRLAGKYAKVESRDDDISCVYARLALGNNSVKIPISIVEIVSKKEYDREGKCINKAEYDKEKDKYEKRNQEAMDERVREVKDRPLQNRNGKYEVREVTKDLWARPGLIVRFVDDSYKSGRLYKCKLRVVDVASRKDISLEDPESGKMYYNLRQSDMETVIPRREGEKVMIVRGTHRGSVAVMENKDRESYKLIARILHSDKVLKIDFDDVCQYLPKNDDDYDD